MLTGLSGAKSGSFPNIGNGGPSSFSGSSTQNSKLDQYLLSHQGSTRYLVATSSALTAGPIILDTGQPVMALGGFTGGDPILTTRQLAQLVSQGTIRFFLISGGGSSGGIMRGNGQLTQWVQQSCKVVSQQLWSSGQNSGAFPPSGNGTQPPSGSGQQPGSGVGPGGLSGQQQLYDCSGVH
jgi:hypothetical protein